MEKKTLLIATNNKGKREEIYNFLKDSNFNVITLADLNITDDVEETEDTLIGNAVLKAMYYGKKTGHLTLADDSGLFIEALDDWPGVKTARVASDDKTRRETVLEKMKEVPSNKRNASFKIALALYNPHNQSTYITEGYVNGTILKKEVTENVINSFGYNQIFYIPAAKKTFAEMTLTEKEAYSHRGKALIKMKYHLHKVYGARHMVVPVGIIISEDGKVFMSKRNDPHNKKVHETWEFPGGSNELGETPEECVVREVKEEVGLTVEVIHSSRSTNIVQRMGRHWSCQIYILPYFCKVVSGEIKLNPHESIEGKWFSPKDILQEKLIENNKSLYIRLLPEIEDIISA